MTLDACSVNAECFVPGSKSVIVVFGPFDQPPSLRQLKYRSTDEIWQRVQQTQLRSHPTERDQPEVMARACTRK